MHKKEWSFLIGLLTVAVLVLLFFVWGRPTNESPNNEITTNTNSTNQASDSPATEDHCDNPPVSADHVVCYEDTGFDVSELSNVAAGETVVFINNSGRSMWVASDEHPSHTELSEFDSMQGIGNGESYSFTFERSGSWGFHDHLAPQHTGIVVVE